jgi:ATP-binding cassette subfamily G (WHITE) protein 2
MHENPADHFLDIITPNISDSVEDLAAREKKLGESYAHIAPMVSEWQE